MLRKTVKYLFRYGWAIAVVSFFAFLLGLPWFLKIMTNDAGLISMARQYFVWIIIIPLTGFAAFLWDGIYIGVTASKAMRNTMIFSTLLVFLPFYYGLENVLGNNALWLAFEMFLLARGVSMWIMWKKMY
jgi:MATE family multidrug resistance protein